MNLTSGHFEQRPWLPLIIKLGISIALTYLGRSKLTTGFQFKSIDIQSRSETVASFTRTVMGNL